MAASTRRWLGSVLTAAIIAASFTPVLAGAVPAATGDGVGVYDPATSVWSLDGGGSFVYGNPGDNPFMGDWDCDGVDTPGLHRAEDTAAGPAGKVYLRNSNTTGIAHVEYFFGDPGDQAFAGDFNGDGCDTVGLFRPATSQVFLTNRLGSRNRGLGAAESSYRFDGQGSEIGGAQAVAGDFDGDGIDTVALYLPATATVLGVGPAPFTFGDPGDHLLVGAWGGGRDSLAVYRPATGEVHLAGSTGSPGDRMAAESRGLPTGGGVPLAWSRAAVANPPATCDGVPATITGTSGNDVLNGTSGDDVIAGLGGNDVIGGKGGNDLICGGDGADVLNGDGGNDVVFGDGGDDNVNGNDGNDRLHGGPGADIITGDKDNDTMFGDGGADNMNGGQGNDFMDGGDGDDLMSGSTGEDTLLGRLGRDVLDGGPDFDTCDLGADRLLSKSKCENERPVANPVQVAAVEDGPPVTGSFSAFEPDGEPVTFAITSGLGPGQGSVVNNGNGTFTFDPGADFQALAQAAIQTVTFQYTASDPNGATSDPATVTVTVTGVDDPPFATDDADATDEDTAITTVNLLANDGDVDAGETVSLIAPLNGPPTSPPDPPSPGGLASALGAAMFNNGNGTFSYDPTKAFQHLGVGQQVIDTIEYTIASTGGGTAHATLRVTVTGRNDAPTADAQSVAGTDTFTITLTASDPDLIDDLTFTAPAATTAGGTLTNLVNNDGTCTPAGSCTAPDKNSATVDYTVPSGGPVPDSFVFTASDGNGGTSSATVTINPADPHPGDTSDAPPLVVGVDAQPTPPELQIEETTTGVPLEIMLFAAAQGPGDPSPIGDLAFTVTVQPPSGEGTVSAPTPILPNGYPADPIRTAKVTYDPQSFGPTDPQDDPAKTTFTFRACDAATGTICDTAVINVEVAPTAPPTPPVAGNLSGIVNTNSSVVIDLAAPGALPDEGEGLPSGRSHAAAAGPDVYFMVDVTGSMSSLLAGIENDILTIMNTVEGAHPTAHFGLGTYDDIGTSLNPQSSGPPFATLFDNLVPLGPKSAVVAKIGASGQQLVNSSGGDFAEAQFFALDRLARTEQARFNPATPSVIVWFGDAPGHDPVCNAISQVGDITEASVTEALQAAGIRVVANSLSGDGLNAAPGPGGEYSDTISPNCAVIGGAAGQATRITAATGGTLLTAGAAGDVATAVLAAIAGTPPELSYSVLLPADFVGTLQTSTGATIPLNTTFALASSKLTYLSTSVPLGTKTKFSYTVTSNITELSATADVFIDVLVVGNCEISVDFCDDGRP